MKLTELEPQFIRYEVCRETVDVITGPDETWRERGCPCHPDERDREYRVPVTTLAEAQGIDFLCPVCFVKNGGPMGTHGVDVTFADRGVSDALGSHNDKGAPSRWSVSGSDVSNLTTQPSIFLTSSPCQWHGFITNGETS